LYHLLYDKSNNTSSISQFLYHVSSKISLFIATSGVSHSSSDPQINQYSQDFLNFTKIYLSSVGCFTIAVVQTNFIMFSSDLGVDSQSIFIYGAILCFI
jgi:hypothetical protein